MASNVTGSGVIASISQANTPSFNAKLFQWRGGTDSNISAVGAIYVCPEIIPLGMGLAGYAQLQNDEK
ncbi:MAG: hypothetical protein JST06_09415 [Bacteroidetes bacterium]|nr:hypothetical protein [Bacteroidota bacterium]MBS1629116.1 hypothetical protein [Bacteroidota bacterium]